MIGTLLSKLTGGMIDLSADEISFSGGPFGEIQGILDQFGLNFNDLITEFMDKFNAFKTDLLDMSSEQQLIFNLRPISLPRFPSILQIGSKMPSMQYSSELNGLLWDKLAATFPSVTFNGVKIPNIPSGLAFADTFPSRGEFPGENIDRSKISFQSRLILLFILFTHLPSLFKICTHFYSLVSNFFS